MDTIGYKLFRVRKDGTLGPLFIDRTLVYKDNVWMKARAVPTKGFAFRPGFHATHAPDAPHLKTEGREWRKVLLCEAVPHLRPASQGGLWYTAQHMKVLPKEDLIVKVNDRLQGRDVNDPSHKERHDRTWQV